MATEINQNELYFEWWLNELQEYGKVKKYIREHQTFLLYKPLLIIYEHKLKTKTSEKEFNLFQDMEYTPDYIVRFDISMSNKIGLIKNNKLINDNINRSNYFAYSTEFDNESIYIYFDCKPTAQAERFSNRVGSSRDFKFNKRLMFEKHNIIVNKVVPQGSATSLFCKTFLPQRYKLTDKNLTPRKLKEYEKKAPNIDAFLGLL
jgi:hypothetical protein